MRHAAIVLAAASQRDAAPLFLDLLACQDECLQAGAAGTDHFERGNLFGQASLDADDTVTEKRGAIWKEGAAKDEMVDVGCLQP